MEETGTPADPPHASVSRDIAQAHALIEYQAAIGEVLRILGNMPNDPQGVFDAILERALRLCRAEFGTLFLYENDALHPTALRGDQDEILKVFRVSSFIPGPETGLGRVLRTKETAHVADVRLGRITDPLRLATIACGARTLLAVPLLNDQALFGALVIYRKLVRPFSEHEIDLVKTFAAQVVVAINTARLLDALKIQSEQLKHQSDELSEWNRQLEKRVNDQVTEIARITRLKRFLPPELAEMIVSSEEAGFLESHRREISILFCDLRGFTSFSEAAAPEDVMLILREYHATLGRLIFEFGGTLERFLGDGVMTLLNDPLPCRDPACQAVRLAVAMRDAMQTLLARWRRYGHELGFGVGIAHGYATLGIIGFEGRSDYTAIGSVVNLASRLCEEARANQILVSQRVLAEAEHIVEVEAPLQLTLKGFHRPVAAYNLTKLKQ